MFARMEYPPGYLNVVVSSSNSHEKDLPLITILFDEDASEARRAFADQIVEDPAFKDELAKKVIIPIIPCVENVRIPSQTTIENMFGFSIGKHLGRFEIRTKERGSSEEFTLAVLDSN
jgi:hypothetical protein